MKKIDINLMKQSGDTLFAHSSEEINFKAIGNKRKILGNGQIGSLTEFHSEIFNLAKSKELKSEPVIFSVNGDVYAMSNPDYPQGLLVNNKFPKSEIERFSNRNEVNFKTEKDSLGMIRIKREDEENLYNLETEKYVRDSNGFTDYSTMEEVKEAINNYMIKDPNQNSYTIQRKDLSVISIDGEYFKEYRDAIPQENNMKNNLENKTINKLKNDNQKLKI